MSLFKLPWLAAIVVLSTFYSTVTKAASTPALSVKLVGAETVDGVKNFKVRSVITNNGNEPVKLLNDPRGLLDNMPTNTFSIANANGVAPKFTGVKVKYVPNHVVATNDPKTFTVLFPGHSVDIEHDLSEAYDFSTSGQSKYTVHGNNFFLYVDPTGTVTPVQAETSGLTTSLSGKLQKDTKRSLQRRLGTSFNQCSESQQTDIDEAAGAAGNYVKFVLDYFGEHDSGTPRYTTWFGNFTDDRYTTVLDHFTKMDNYSYMDDYTYDCGTCDKPDVFAYVYPDQFGTIYLCPAFWRAQLTGTDSKAGTLVHESSHFTIIAGTQDYAYGQPLCKDLAQKYPDYAIMNADSHEYFAEDDPPLA